MIEIHDIITDQNYLKLIAIKKLRNFSFKFIFHFFYTILVFLMVLNTSFLAKKGWFIIYLIEFQFDY